MRRLKGGRFGDCWIVGIRLCDGGLGVCFWGVVGVGEIWIFGVGS